jgi:hypothetical protein
VSEPLICTECGMEGAPHHYSLCVKVLRVQGAAWKKGVEDANRISQRFEAENVKLRAALQEIASGRYANYCDCAGAARAAVSPRPPGDGPA